MAIGKIALVTIWIGEMPDYFCYWSKSCELNKEIDFYLYTDQHIESTVSNLHIKKLDLKQFNELASEKTKLNIHVKQPYKLCDYRPAFGKIFEDDLRQYSYWGYCDMDLVFGRIMHFISPAIKEGYQKINHNGHLTIFKNTDQNKFLYKEKGAKFSYDDVFSSDEHYAFDEFCGIWAIAKKNKIKEFNTKEFVDFDRRVKELVDINGDVHKKQAFIWKNGRAYLAYLHHGRIVKHEKLYFHFQKRNPKVIDRSSVSFQITPSEFKCLNGESDIEFRKRKKLTSMIEKAGYYWKRLGVFWGKSFGEQLRWIRRKISER